MPPPAAPMAPMATPSQASSSHTSQQGSISREVREGSSLFVRDTSADVQIPDDKDFPPTAAPSGVRPRKRLFEAENPMWKDVGSGSSSLKARRTG
jgi:hypothetical protein